MGGPRKGTVPHNKINRKGRRYGKLTVLYEEKGNRWLCLCDCGNTVCKRWHDFENFVADMGERPKRYNLGRKNYEKEYCLDNCLWEHISDNCRDTANSGMPTRPGILKGAKPRSPIKKVVVNALNDPTEFSGEPIPLFGDES